MSPNEKFTPDHKTMIMSSGKTVAAVLIAKMVDQGLLNYEDEVGKVWAEFASNGKEKMKVEDVMRHEAGMAIIPE